MEGIELLFDVRKDRRGGGTAVAVCAESFLMTRLNIKIPNGLEVTVVKIKSKQEDVNAFPIIVFSIYSSPRSKFKSQLIDFLMLQISQGSWRFSKYEIPSESTKKSMFLERNTPYTVTTYPAPKYMLNFLCTLYNLKAI